MPLSGCKVTANRRQYKIKKELFSFLLLRCSVPYLKVLQIEDNTNRVDVGSYPQHLSLHRTYGSRIRRYIHIGERKL